MSAVLAVELVELFARLLCDDAGDGGLAGAGWPVENQVCRAAGLGDAVEDAVLVEDVALPDHLVDGLRTHQVRQWSAHQKSAPLCQKKFGMVGIPIIIAGEGMFKRIFAR